MKRITNKEIAEFMGEDEGKRYGLSFEDLFPVLQKMMALNYTVTIRTKEDITDIRIAPMNGLYQRDIVSTHAYKGEFNQRMFVIILAEAIKGWLSLWMLTDEEYKLHLEKI